MVQSHADDAFIKPGGIDHLLYASSDLQRGMDEIEALLGVRPVRGGHHPQYGTHNALLSLGPGVYLEIIARDPELSVPERGVFVDMHQQSMSRLVTWVLRTPDIEATAATARSAGIGIGDIESGSRTRPDGGKISWELTSPYAMPMNGAVPFLINWGSTPHPSTVVPSGGRLLEVVIEHFDAERVHEALSALGADVGVVAGEEFRITATIETGHGPVTLR